MNPWDMSRRWAFRIPGVIVTRLPATSTLPPWATAVSQFRDSAVLGDSRFLTRVFKQVSNLNKTGVEALVVVGVRVELEAGRAPDDDALAVAPVDAAGLGAPGVEARAVAPARLAVDFALAFALPPGVEAREVAACALRALPNFQRLARTSCLWHAMN